MEYIKSLIRTIFSKENIGVVAFMIMNIVPICWLFSSGSVLPQPMLYVILLFLYFFLVLTSGELIARRMLKANEKVSINEESTLSIAFSIAYVTAKSKNPIISDKIRVYIFRDIIIDSYALGRNTLCISSAAANLPESELITLFLMKFAQFSHHDSEILAILTGGNLLYMAAAAAGKLFIAFIGFIVSSILSFKGHNLEASVFDKVRKAMEITVEKISFLFSRLMLKLGVGTYRNNIYINDTFVCDCGYKNALIRFLQAYEPDHIGQETIFGAINSMKPNKTLRLSRIQIYETVMSQNSDRFRITRR